MDIFTELYRQSTNTDSAKLARAQVAALSTARSVVGSFVELAKTASEGELRLSLTEDKIRTICSSVGEQYNVEATNLYDYVYSKLAADVAVTDPKRVKPDSPIGGTEGKKYQNTDDVPEDGKADAETDIAEMDPVLEDEPKRHKLKHDDKMDTQEDNEPGSGSGSTDSKAFPNHASTKTADSYGSADISDLINVCRAYAHMGSAIQEQLDSILDSGGVDSVEEGYLNMNAVPYMKEFLEAAARFGYEEEAQQGLEMIQSEDPDWGGSGRL